MDYVVVIEKADDGSFSAYVARSARLRIMWRHVRRGPATHPRSDRSSHRIIEAASRASTAAQRDCVPRACQCAMRIASISGVRSMN